MNAPAYKVKKILTRPLLKFAKDIPIHVLIEGKMYIGKEMRQKEGEKKKEPATLVDVVNLDTGEQCQVICSAVVKSVLNEEYSGDAYVGKAFRITKLGRAAGKSYDAYGVAEIEVPKSKAA